MENRRYESVVIIYPDQGEAGAKDVAARIRTLLEEQGATVGQVQEWGLRELAYPVAKQRRGFYVLFEFRATPRTLAEVERQLKIMDPVLRFQSATQAENAPPTPPRTAPRVESSESEGTSDEVRAEGTQSAPSVEEMS